MTKKELNKKAAVAGFFFVFIQLFVRGISFILTPIYTRLVSKAQYGDIRVYESWLLIVVPIVSLSLYRSVDRAKYDFEDDFEGYVSSVQTLSYLSIIACFSFISLVVRKTFMNVCGLDSLMYWFMVIYSFSHTTIWYYQRREKQMLRYKNSVIVTAVMMIPATILSVVLLYWGNVTEKKDSLVDLRVIGYYLPQIIVGLFAAFVIANQGRKFINKKYWKYALAISLPLIPETISIQIMNQSDKIMIQKMVGAESTGVFALATTISFIIWIVEDAVWNAWTPWLFEKFSRDEVEDVKKPWTVIALLFSFFSWTLVILAPEIIWLLGGDKYKEAIYLVAPMLTGTLIRFFVNAFTAVEYYKKKTAYCALGTFVAMVINVILNAVCIRYIGYQAAAYTTAASYFILMVLQGYLEKKTCGMRCVSMGKMVVLALICFAVNILTMWTYSLAWYLRWLIFATISGIVAWFMWPKVKQLLKQFKKKK